MMYSHLLNFTGKQLRPTRRRLSAMLIALVGFSPAIFGQSSGPNAAGKYILIRAAGHELPAVVAENPSSGFKQEVTGGFVELRQDGVCAVSTDYRYTENGRTETSTSESEGRYEISGESVILIFGSDRLQGTLKGGRLTIRADVELTLQLVRDKDSRSPKPDSMREREQ